MTADTGDEVEVEAAGDEVEAAVAIAGMLRPFLSVISLSIVDLRFIYFFVTEIEAVTIVDLMIAGKFHNAFHLFLVYYGRVRG
jgi:hypothetical protein